MTVATFRAPVFTTQDPATYKTNIDAGFSVSKRLLDAFAPHAQTTADMTVAIDAGFTFYNNTLLEVAAQNSTAIAISSSTVFSRIDRVVVDQQTGVYSLVSGTSLAPAIPAGKMPVAQVAVTTASTAITNAMITDERAFPSSPVATNYQVFASTTGGTWTKPTGFSTNSKVLIMAWAGGGGGSTYHGGGGGAFIEAEYKLSDLTTSVTVTIGNGGAASAHGGNTSFGSFFTVYGGGSTASDGGGGGGIYGQSTVAGDGGSPSGGTTAQGYSNFGGGAGGGAVAGIGGLSVYGGGGGGFGSTVGTGGAGGRSMYGGGGGAGVSVGAAALGGASILGGAGGNGSTAVGTGVAGTAPGGGGGNNAAGADGELRVWVFPS